MKQRYLPHCRIRRCNIITRLTLYKVTNHLLVVHVNRQKFIREKTNLKAHFNSLSPSDAYMRQWTKHHWLRQWLVAWPASSHYLNQYWNIVWTLRNKVQWNSYPNSNIFIQENVFESVVCEMAAILSRPQCVKLHGPCPALGLLPLYKYTFTETETWEDWNHNQIPLIIV